MAGRRTHASRPSLQVQVPTVDDSTTQRAFDVLTTAVQNIQNKRQRDVVTADLVVGTNKVSHGLGRPCTGFTVTLSATNLNFSAALDKTNTNPDHEVWVTVAGSAAAGVSIEVY